MAPEVLRGDLYEPEPGLVVCWMRPLRNDVGKCRGTYDCVYRELFPTHLTHAAASILRDVLHPEPRRRLGARGDTS
jgi:hypothetical protein